LEKVYVTGIGITGPCGNTAKEFWDGLLSGKSFISTLSGINKDIFPSNIGGMVKNITPEKYFSRRLLNKCSRFSVLSLLACNEALGDAGIDMTSYDKTRIGIFVGNNSGGWESANNGLKVLHREGPQYISPFLASNWFPAAPQGHISLAFGIKGYSKTVISDRVSGLLAIAYAARTIRAGLIDAAIVGGVETPLDEWALQFYHSSGILCSSYETPEKAYRPFDRRKQGMVLAEGAAFMVLESAESVRKRNAGERVRANIREFCMVYDGTTNAEPDTKVEQYKRAIDTAIKRSVVNPDDIRLICPDGTAVEEDDMVEVRALNEYWGSKSMDKYCTCPKASFGNTIGAASAFDAVLSILSMNTSTLPFISNLEDEGNCRGLNFVKKENIRATINSSLILSRGFGGVAAAMVINNREF